MKTTALMIEFLLGGILVLVALVLLTMSIYPIEMQNIISQISKSQSLLTSAPLFVVMVFTAFSYAVGVLSEFIGLVAFEWWHDKIKKDRMAKYLKVNYANLMKSPILKKYAGTSSKKNDLDKEDARSCIGAMRFYVLMKSSALYGEIESQINRLRLIRVLFLVEFILILAIGWQVIREPSFALFCLWIFVVAIASVNVAAIKNRFHRYCRAVERSYKSLVLEQDSKTDNN